LSGGEGVYGGGETLIVRRGGERLLRMEREMFVRIPLGEEKGNGVGKWMGKKESYEKWEEKRGTSTFYNAKEGEGHSVNYIP